jgi:hypothetical protein
MLQNRFARRSKRASCARIMLLSSALLLFGCASQEMRSTDRYGSSVALRSICLDALELQWQEGPIGYGVWSDPWLHWRLHYRDRYALHAVCGHAAWLRFDPFFSYSLANPYGFHGSLVPRHPFTSGLGPMRTQGLPMTSASERALELLRESERRNAPDFGDEMSRTSSLDSILPDATSPSERRWRRTNNPFAPERRERGSFEPRTQRESGPQHRGPSERGLPTTEDF